MKVVLINPDKKQDYTTELIVEGLKKLDCDIIASAQGNGISRIYDDISLVKHSKDADAILCFFGKVRDNNPPKHYLVQSLGEKRKRAFIDGSEWTSSGNPTKNQMNDSLSDPRKRRGSPWINESMRNDCQFYFKRETYQQDFDDGIIPLPFGLMDRHVLDVVEKDIDVFCVMGQLKTGLREPVYKKCLELAATTQHRFVISDSIPRDEYKKLIARSKVVIDAWGGGDNCDRFYEAVGSRSCCLYQQYQTIVTNRFIDNEHAVSYADMHEFSYRLNTLLENKELIRKIGKTGYDHAMTYHTSKTRASLIINTIMGQSSS